MITLIITYPGSTWSSEHRIVSTEVAAWHPEFRAARKAVDMWVSSVDAMPLSEVTWALDIWNDCDRE